MRVNGAGAVERVDEGTASAEGPFVAVPSQNRSPTTARLLSTTLLREPDGASAGATRTRTFDTVSGTPPTAWHAPKTSTSPRGFGSPSSTTPPPVASAIAGHMATSATSRLAAWSSENPTRLVTTRFCRPSTWNVRKLKDTTIGLTTFMAWDRSVVRRGGPSLFRGGRYLNMQIVPMSCMYAFTDFLTRSYSFLTSLPASDLSFVTSFFSSSFLSSMGFLQISTASLSTILRAMVVSRMPPTLVSVMMPTVTSFLFPTKRPNVAPNVFSALLPCHQTLESA